MNRGTARYPLLEIDLDKLKANLAALIERCQSLSVEVAGVVKGFSALPEAAGVYTECGVRSLASSRLSQLRALRGAGVACERVLIRIPMLSELPEVAEVADMSLQSELETLRALNAVCAKRGTRHRVILMADLGDLREGFWSREELVDAALEVEYKLDHLELAGVGTNLGCYGSVAATPEKLRELVSAAEAVERAIGRELQYISGGASTSVHMVLDGTLPARVNHLRIGEGILVSKDLQVDWGIHDMDYLRMDCMTLRAQIVEVKDKPTHPVGPIVVDCFCNRPTYEDRGIRRRAIAGIGRADVGDVMMLRPRTPGMTVVGGSSDHCILDVEDCHPCPRVGDVVDFDVIYLTMLYASAREDVPVVFVD